MRRHESVVVKTVTILLLHKLLTGDAFHVNSPMISRARSRAVSVSSSFRSPPTTRSISRTTAAAMTRRNEDYYNDEDGYYEEGNDQEYTKNARSEKYDDDDDDDMYDDTGRRNGGGNSLEWESYNNVDILLPQSTSNPPRAIIHFIGGTFLGSLPPRIIYSQFLEGISKESRHDVVILATPIPFLLEKNFKFSSPLDHRKKSQSIRDTLKDVYRNVLLDEYSSDELRNVPFIGVGHSLGGRLHVLLNSCKRNKRYDRTKANIFVSFNNWNAKKSVPVLNQVADMMKDEKKTSKRRRRDAYEEEDDYDSWGERRKESPAFEFNPAPQKLWDIIQGKSDPSQRTSYSNYDISKNLIVQFDQDNLDQSAQLANYMVKSDSSVSEEDENIPVLQLKRGLKYARLKGTHLTPCLELLNDDLPGRVLSSRGGAKGRNIKEQQVQRKQNLEDLISTVATYIDSVVDEQIEIMADSQVDGKD